LKSNNSINEIINSIRSTIIKTHHKMNSIHSGFNINLDENLASENSCKTQSESKTKTLIPGVEYCSIHSSRPLEIICVDHKIKLCMNCALFGEHKNHKIVNEEDFIKEIDIKAEVLMELFEIINFNLNKSSESEAEKYLSEKLFIRNKEKKTKNIKEIEGFSQELIKKVRIMEADAIDQVDKNYEKINTKIKEINKIPSELLARSEDWKINVQKKLDILNQITESKDFIEEYEKLIEIKITDGELISSAEDILNDFCKVKNFQTVSVENMIEKNEIVFNDKLSNEIIFSSLKFVNFESDKEGAASSDQVKEKRKEITLNKSETKKNIHEADESGVNTNRLTNYKSNSNTNNISNIYENSTSFLNSSEDSQICKLNNSNDNKIKKQFQTPENYSNNNNHDFRFSSCPGNSKSTIKFEEITLINMPCSKKESSCSPVKKNSIHKDKIAFIRLQFKNETVNFTGQGKIFDYF